MRRTPGHVLRRTLPLLIGAAVLVPVAAAQGATVTATLTPPAPNATGWFTSPVGVTWITDDPDYVPVPATDSATTDGTFTKTTTACSTLDPLAPCVPGSVTFKIDQTPPNVSITRPAAGTYDMGPAGVIGLQNEPITAVYDCA